MTGRQSISAAMIGLLMVAANGVAQTEEEYTEELREVVTEFKGKSKGGPDKALSEAMLASLTEKGEELAPFMEEVDTLLHEVMPYRHGYWSCRYGGRSVNDPDNGVHGGSKDTEWLLERERQEGLRIARFWCGGIRARDTGRQAISVNVETTMRGDLPGDTIWTVEVKIAEDPVNAVNRLNVGWGTPTPTWSGSDKSRGTVLRLNQVGKVKELLIDLLKEGLQTLSSGK